MDRKVVIRVLKKKTIRSIALAVLLLSLILILYQLVLVKMIEESNRGMFDKLNVQRYSNPSEKENVDIMCHHTKKLIHSSKINDDYCDCPDGTDEPNTNACPENKFLCYDGQKSVILPSSRVNDGICDCCDGSDEWKKEISPVNLDIKVQKKIGIFLSPCPNVCPK